MRFRFTAFVSIVIAISNKRNHEKGQENLNNSYLVTLNSNLFCKLPNTNYRQV